MCYDSNHKYKNFLCKCGIQPLFSDRSGRPQAFVKLESEKKKKTDLLSIIKIDLLHLFRMKTMERKKNVLISID